MLVVRRFPLMGAIEAALALVGFVSVIGVVVRWHLNRQPTQAFEEDLAEPYREGLHASIRLQRAAQDAEARIYAEAAKRIDSTVESE
jgi:cell division protein FtsL